MHYTEHVPHTEHTQSSVGTQHTHRVQSRKQATMFLLSASTNGQILIWDLTKELYKQYGASTGDSVSTQRLQQETALSDGGIKEDVEADKDIPAAYIDFDQVTQEIGDTFKSPTVASVKEDWQPLTSLPAHQSGVNSLHAMQLSGRWFYWIYLVDKSVA